MTSLHLRGIECGTTAVATELKVTSIEAGLIEQVVA
jgi:hypothetical protein